MKRSISQAFIESDSSDEDDNVSTKKPDLEEGEVDDDSSDDDSGSVSSVFSDGYDENMLGDEEDRRRLNSMTEKEREQEIYKRIEQREIMRTRFDIEKKLRQQKKRETKKLKKSDPTPSQISSKLKSLDAKERSKERKKTVEAKVDKKTQAMDLLKAKREAKRERAEEKEKLRVEQDQKREDNTEFERSEREDYESKTTITEKSVVKKKLKASDIYSDDSASDWENSSTVRVKRERSDTSSDSDSDDENRNTEKPVEYVDNVADLNQIKLSRSKIEKWLHCPFFNKVAKGCFVRVGIGFNSEKPIYQVAEVLDVVETSRIYSLGNTRTNKGFKVRHGSYEKVFRFEYISQSDFEPNEFKRWNDTCEKNGIIRPTLDDIEKKLQELSEASNYEYKEADIEHIIAEKMKFKQSPVNFAVRKTQLMKEKDTALQKGEERRAEELSREIADLDERAKELDKERSKSIQSIGYINQRNRKKNVEQAEKAILEEMLETKGKRNEDPFTRRNTKPRMVHRPTGQQDAVDGLKEIKSEPTSSDEQVVSSIQDTAVEAKKILDKLNLDDVKVSTDLLEAEVKGSAKPLSTGDLFHAHDFDIKLELDEKVVPPNLPIVARAIIPPQVRDVTPRRSLNLEDYKRKRGLI